MSSIADKTDAKKEEQPKVSMRDFLRLIRDIRPPLGPFFFAIFLSLISTVASLAVPMFTKSIVDGFSLANLSAQTIIVLLAAFLVQGVVGALSLYMLNKIGQGVVARLRERLWKKLLSQPVSFYDERASGDLLSRMNNDTALLKSLLAENFSGFLGGIISIVASIIFLFSLNWSMSLVILSALPVATAIIIPIGRALRKIAIATLNENARFTEVLARALGEIRLVKASNAEGFELERGSGAIKNLYKFGVREGKYNALLGPLIGLVMMSLLVLILGYGGYLISSGGLTAGSLVAFILYLFQIIIPLTTVTQFFTQVQKARGATETIQSILEAPEEPRGNGLAVPAGGVTVEFENVEYAYNAEKPVLRGVSFRLEPGTVTALVGPSGSGKTTIFSLVEGFYRPQAGSIVVAGKPLAEYNLDSWRRSIGYVPQDSPLLAGTLAENLRYGLDREVSAEEMRAAAVQAYADEFISGFPQGYDTDVGERGIKLSGGQRQRIAITRAILRNPQLLMLDEATSSLDSESEHWVKLALENLMKGRTTLVIAHRLSTVIHADRLLFLEDGTITGAGTHRELYDSHQRYRGFAERQFDQRDERA